MDDLYAAVDATLVHRAGNLLTVASAHCVSNRYLVDFGHPAVSTGEYRRALARLGVPIVDSEYGPALRDLAISPAAYRTYMMRRTAENEAVRYEAEAALILDAIARRAR
ncbi:hypothetical protein AB0K86_06135 [Streptomyces clavifer]|uniref:hypothetical protein n=1 Tax=Streptomyces TaxID=1883 RepID=UPI0012FEFC1F|nr:MULTISPECIES: hypothetical protein [unclassified Streptomyces]